MSECTKLNGCKEIQELRLRLINSICPHVYEELKAERDDLRASMKNIPTFYKEAAQEMIDTYRYAAEQRIEELETKLAVAQDWVNKQADMIDGLEKQRDEAREGWQGSILKVEDLKYKLAVAEQANEAILNAAENSNEQLVKAIANHWRKSNNRLRENVLKERDEYKAHNALLVGNLRQIIRIIGYLDDNVTDTEAEIMRIASRDIDTIPSESYERVQGLVEALEAIFEIGTSLASYPLNERIRDIVSESKQALNKYRGDTK